ncbi:isopentenyl-diphosphate delta-isomerase [Lachnospiraceae bacterium WCA-9-b2]|jgi:Predicted ATPase of the ABC class|uniref:Isopentenyl-diphosphate delta-isomerase n=2 Tax=Sporofaciens musculi TaxID=2681861 RepID=A0A7X3MGQ3_9FIRM|nr:ABC-ATPase domain-containing protein [Sporofaciens musculi]MXP76140.1 isopentenyl-diphosphate delta-isomerase [Sporofaciens musculi]
MKTAEDLRQLLDRIDHRGYPAYKDTKGVYQFQRYVLSIDHVQGDPFAAPSKLSLRVPGRAAGFLKELFDRKHKRIALQDMLIRNFYGQIQQYSFQAKGSGKSGIINVTRCSQEILERTACEINPSSGDVTVRFEVGFPANGRTINSRELKKILYDFLPSCVEKALYYGRLDKERVKKVVELAQDQEAIKSQLEAMGLVAFVANGSILPRESGVSQRPMKGAVPFVSPKSMEVTMELPYRGKISGMGIKKGVTLIVGGGYHGKSTLLKALEMGVYPHIAGDGREYVVTDPTAMKIRAEDGRSIKHTDISMFINDLPNGKDTAAFDTEDASGSTSQAANVVESVEAGAKVFLIDEDTSATNFMVRDELMQRVIHRDMEPITPFIERVRALYEEFKISTVIVAGSSGAYFQVADSIVQMDRYVPKEITKEAKAAAEDYPKLELPKEGPKKPSLDRKIRSYPALKSKGRIKIKTMGRDGVTLNHETIDLRYVEQLVDSEQLVTLGNVVKHLEENVFDGKKTLSQTIEELYKRLDSQGLGAVCDGSYLSGNLAMPRKQEIYACLNRYRKLGTARR